MRLENKIALVTGAARGIGKEIARVFGKEGATVIITDVLEKELFQTTREFKKEGINASPILQDVSKESQWKNVINKIIKEYSHLHILVNNAGMGGKEGVSETTLDQWKRMQEINLQSVYLGMKYTAEVMKENNSGSIINVSSIYGSIGTGGGAAYHASKSGIVGLTKTAALEYAKNKIRVNTIHPGVIQTDMIEWKLKDEVISNDLRAKTPLPFLGEPLDIAYGALYLASDESKFVTGTQLFIDGGYTAE